jgi:ParB family chromosome partitioning protein
VRSIVLLDPFRCRMWDLHDRLESHINERSCRAEIESFSKHGQLAPVVGRPVTDSPGYDAELIYGARRLFVARHLKKLLAVELREISDKEALIAMDGENRLRKDISPYERALSYSQWLRSGHFRSQDEIARTLRMSPSQVSRVLRLSQLPSIVVEAFGDPTEICEDWGIKLVTILQDREKRPGLIEKARWLVGHAGKLSAQEVYRQLLGTTARGRKLRTQSHDLVVRGEDGAKLFRIRYQRNLVAVLLPVEQLEEQTINEISVAIAAILRDASAQVSDLKPHPPAKVDLRQSG